MNIRTDLALELREDLEDEISGVESDENLLGHAKITRIRIVDSNGEKAIGKPKGTYVTVEVPPFTENSGMDDDALAAVKEELGRLLPENGTVLVVGLGNESITPDAFGPRTAGRVIATRHISGDFARSIGLDGLRSVAVVSPGVLGNTGIESSEIIRGVADKTGPSCVICIDALASRSLARLGSTIQISDSGISPGSGVGNSRKELSEKTLGIPVISLGVPTVVDAATMVKDLTG
ncbi:MAG: GPR endopeptidase, partial [Clostridia bacterium]|nr:GPR endopeptidase [Clostridia bacterium]